MSTPAPARGVSGFWPLALLNLALLAVVGGQLYQAVAQRQLLRTVLADQQQPVADARQVREQLQNLVTGTARLAAAGNANAQRLQAELQRLGVAAQAP